MSSSNFRTHASRRQDRRVKERRAHGFPFGSPEWLERVQQEHFLWPKKERRRFDRRAQDRRNNSGRARDKPSSLPVTATRTLLTEEEIKMLTEMMRQGHQD